MRRILGWFGLKYFPAPMEFLCACLQLEIDCSQIPIQHTITSHSSSFLQTYSQITHHLHKMFRRALLQQSQAAKSALSVRPLSTTSLSQRITAPIRSQHILKPIAPRVWQRYSSTETEGEKKEGESSAEGKNGEQQAESATEALQKELEAMKQEVVDLKVR